MFTSGKAMMGLLLVGVALAGCTTNTNSTNGDVATKQLHTVYKDNPFSASQNPTPDHEWSFIDAGKTRAVFVHWMEHDGGHDAETATEIFAVGDMFKGKACKGDAGITQEDIDAGYVHFHKQNAANWDAGHGWTTGTEDGFWLRHVAVKGGVNMMGPGPSEAGKIYKMMDTTANLKDC